MDKTKRLFFIALLPPQEIQDSITEIKQYFAENFSSRAALKSPPHITLQPPFEWHPDEISQLQDTLSQFALKRDRVPISLSGFSAFPERVIYVNVCKTPELWAIHQDLQNYLEGTIGIFDPMAKTRPFAPHVTVAFRDLTKPNFKAAWPQFKTRQLYFEFIISQLTLLIHDGQKWNICAQFPLNS
ncbi:MAG: hypothetical protein RLZZ338_1086 [Cyanobacteriota bacterium]|jgi:2'-5' RNA ligase